MTRTESEAVRALLPFADPIRGLGWNPGSSAEPGLNVARTRTLLDLAGAPDREMTCVLVAGTKGKGSTATMLASILSASGIRSGLYTSPHLQSWRERIRVDGAAVGPAAFARNVTETVRLVARLRRQRGDLGEPSAFELVTVAALGHFRRARCRVAILEVGLGGRYDATNAVDPAVSIIASIGHDHQAILGRSLARIAREKAGVLRAGRPALIAPQRPSAERAIGLACRRERAHCSSVAPLPRGVRVGLAGDHQRQNAALARAAARELAAMGHDIPAAAVRLGLQRASLTGRFEIVAGRPLVVLDVAHTPESVAALAATLRRLSTRSEVRVVLGCTADRDPGALARPLRALRPRFYATAAHGPRAMPAAEVAAALGRSAAGPFADVVSAIAAAREDAPRGAIVCVTGSAALAGEARTALGLPMDERLWHRTGRG